MLVQGFQVWPWAGQGLAPQWEMFPLPKTRGSVARPPKLTSLLPGIPRLGQETRSPARPQNSSRRRLWLFGTWGWGGTRKN